MRQLQMMPNEQDGLQCHEQPGWAPGAQGEHALVSEAWPMHAGGKLQPWFAAACRVDAPLPCLHKLSRYANGFWACKLNSSGPAQQFHCQLPLQLLMLAGIRNMGTLCRLQLLPSAQWHHTATRTPSVVAAQVH